MKTESLYDQIHFYGWEIKQSSDTLHRFVISGGHPADILGQITRLESACQHLRNLVVQDRRYQRGFENGTSVRLTTDLTKYDQRLIVGVEGVTIGKYGKWSQSNDDFVGVDFPGIGKFDILWKSLEIFHIKGE